MGVLLLSYSHDARILLEIGKTRSKKLSGKEFLGDCLSITEDMFFHKNQRCDLIISSFFKKIACCNNPAATIGQKNQK
ncbi:MAG: hypothetical protein VKK59_01795 [Vampirovibrionales bacterium]|nr:hypothetical protein [Vampirovibrionales bacterium]